MENYFYSSSESPSPIPTLDLLPPPHKSMAMPLQADEPPNCMPGYQEFSFFPALYPEKSNIEPGMRESSHPRLGLEPFAALQTPSLNGSFSTRNSTPVTPTGSIPESLELGECNLPHSYSTDVTSQPRLKRRLQNREAQRRFRQRKEERQQTLEQKNASLETKYQELLEELNKKSEEASQIRKENEALSTEIDDLRKRWRLLVLLLSRPNGLQSLSMLLGEEPDQPSSGISSTRPGPAPMLSSFVDCLQPLLSPTRKEMSHIPIK